MLNEQTNQPTNELKKTNEIWFRKNGGEKIKENVVFCVCHSLNVFARTFARHNQKRAHTSVSNEIMELIILCGNVSYMLITSVRKKQD